MTDIPTIEPAAPVPEPSADHLLRLRPDGSVQLPNGVILHPPKMGALKRLRIAQDDIRSAIEARALEIQPQEAKLRDRLLMVIAVRSEAEFDPDLEAIFLNDGTKVPTITQEVRKMSAAKLAAEQIKVNKELTLLRRTFSDEQSAQWTRWFRDCYKVCAQGAPSLPDDDDDLDPWMSHQLLAGSILSQFEGIPISGFGQ